MMQPWPLPLAGACAEQVTRLHDVVGAPGDCATGNGVRAWRDRGLRMTLAPNFAPTLTPTLTTERKGSARDDTAALPFSDKRDLVFRHPEVIS